MDWKYENGRIYSVDQNNELMAEATFVVQENGVVVIDHSYVNPVLRGQQVAGNMMEVVSDYLRAWLEKHRESPADVIAPNMDAAN